MGYDDEIKNSKDIKHGIMWVPLCGLLRTSDYMVAPYSSSSHTYRDFRTLISHFFTNAKKIFTNAKKTF